jgi:type I site-specific restriction endonuclease
MKKLFLTLGLASLFMVACNNTPKQPEQPAAPAEEQKTEVVEEKHECPMDALKNEYAKWDEMTDEAKAELNKKACELFTQMDAKKAEMEAAGEQVCKEMAEMTEEAKAECEKKCAEMKAAWDNFANMTVDEQKDLIMSRLQNCGGEKECCKHEGEEGHQCQHDAK